MSVTIGQINLWIIDLLRGTKIADKLKDLREEQFLNSTLLSNKSDSIFNEHVNYVKEHSLFYKNRFAINDLNILTKDIIQNNRQFIFSDNYHGKVFQKATGGSSGNPLVYFTTPEAQSFMWAAILLSWETAGYKLGDKVAFISGTSLWKKDLKHHLFYRLLNIKVYSAYNLSDSDIINYLTSISYSKINLIYAYASVLDRIAEFILKNKVHVSHSLKAIVSSAEVLSNSARQRIEEAFKVRVFNQYGCNEAAVSAFECEYGQLHLINTATRVYTDQEDNLIATNLVNKAFPIINYHTGDKVKLSKMDECLCGRGYPVIEEVIGRTFEFLVDAKGKSLNASFFSILFRTDETIEKYQVLYDSRMITVVFKLNTDNYHSNSYQQYADKIKEYLIFEEYRVLINQPFFSLPNGKHLQVVNLTKYKNECLV